MAEITPKLLELKFLKRISKVIILPLLIASYISQTGLNVSEVGLNLSINTEATFFTQFVQFIAIFSFKAMLVSIPAWLVHHLMPRIHFYTYWNWLQRSLLSILTIFPIAFGFLGVFSGKELPFLSLLNPSWFFTSFILGFYLLAVEGEIENDNSEDNDHTYSRKNFPLWFFGKDDF